MKTEQSRILPNVGVVGAGKLGSALIRRLHECSALAWAFRRSASEDDFPQGISWFTSIEGLPFAPEYIVLAVSDGALAEVSDALSAHFGENLSGKTLVHCSGALTRSELSACEMLGARTVAIHPYQTFADFYPNIFENIGWGIDARAEDRERARNFVEILGGSPIFLSEETLRRKSLYHASAVTASNYLVMLAVSAAELATVSGINAHEFIPAIMRQTLENALSGLDGKSEIPLTGPIARGDIETVRKHIEALREFPALLENYRLLGRATANIALHRGKIAPEIFKKFEEIFAGKISSHQS